MISIHASLRGYNLPKRGWLKPCVYCEAITGQTIDLNEKYKIYICPACKKKKQIIILNLILEDIILEVIIIYLILKLRKHHFFIENFNYFYR